MGEYYEKLRKSGSLPESEANPKIEQAYQAVIENYPDCKSAPYAALKLGRMDFERGQWVEAAVYFELFLEKFPQNEKPARILYQLGQTYEKMGQFDKAELELQNSIKQIPYSPLLFRGMGNLMYSRENYETAISNYEKALQLGGNKLILINNIAGAYYSTGKIESAYKYIRMAESLGIQLNPELVRTIKTAYDIH